MQGLAQAISLQWNTWFTNDAIA